MIRHSPNSHASAHPSTQHPSNVLRVANTYFVDAHRTVIHVLPDGTAGSAEGDAEEGDDDDEGDGALAHKPLR